MDKGIKKILFVGLIFIMIITMLVLTINFIYVKIILNQKTILRGEIQYEDMKGDIEILFMGDSHPANAVNTSYFDNSFNFAELSESYDQTYFKFRKSVKDNPNLKVVVIPLEFYSFSDYRANKYVYVWYWLKYLGYEDLSKITGKSKLNLYIGTKIPVLGNGIELFRLFGQQDTTKIINGWHTNTGNWTAVENKNHVASERIKVQFKNKYDIDAELFYYFLKIIDLAHENDIKVVIVKYPLSPEYISEIEKTPFSIESYYMTVDNFVSQKENVLILDYHDFYTDSKLFANQDHLNINGANVFSKELSERIAEEEIVD